MGDIERDLERLRVATREAHEATKDLRAAVKEARQVIEDVERVAAVEVDQRITTAVATGLAEYQDSLAVAIKEATDKVFARFDTIRDTLLGETRGQRRRGEPSIPELIDARNPGASS